MERRRFSGVMLLFIVLAVVLITQVVGNLGRSGDVSYSDMRAYFTAEKVKSFTATDTRLVAKLQDGSSVSCALHSFDTFYNDMNDLVVSQAEKGVITSYDYAAGSENGWLRTLLPYVLAAMAFILLMNLMTRMNGSGAGGVSDKMAHFGEARVSSIPEGDKKVTFKDDLEVMMPCPPMQLTEYATRPYTSAGRLGADTDSIFHDLGYTDSEIAAMKDSGAIQ